MILLVYDADCGICQKAVEKLQIWVPNKFKVRASSNQLTEKIKETMDVVIEPELYMYLINLKTMQIYRGYDAFREVFSLGTRTRFLHYMMRAPLVPFLGRIVYRLIANNRRRLSGPGAKCGI